MLRQVPFSLVGLVLILTIPLLSIQCIPASYCLGERGELGLDPDGAQCSRRCECNNVKFEGYCIKNQCIAVPRHPCGFAGQRAKCIPPTQLKGLLEACGDREQVCEDLNGNLRWGDCACIRKETTEGNRYQEPIAADKVLERAQEPVVGEKSRESFSEVREVATHEKIPTQRDGGEQQSESQTEALSEHLKESPTLEQYREQQVIPEHSLSPKPQGSPCKGLKTHPCYSAHPKTQLLGICKKGLQTCTSDGLWSWCDGEIVPLKEFCNKKDDDCDGQIDEQCTQENWPLLIGGTTTHSKVTSMGLAIGPKDELYLGGRYKQTVALGKFTESSGWSFKGFLFKLAANGQPLAFASTSAPDLEQITVAPPLKPGGEPLIHIVGTFSQKASFGALSLTGKSEYANLYWATLNSKLQFISVKGFFAKRRIYQKGTFGQDIVADTKGNIHILGTASTAAELGGKEFPPGLFAVKYDRDGKILLWSFSASKGGGGELTANSMEVDTSGNVYIVGDFTGTADFGGKKFTAKGKDLYVLKLNSSGRLLWVHTFGGSFDDEAHAIEVTPSGLYIGGSFTKEATFGSVTLKQKSSVPGKNGFVLHMDSSGKVIWGNAILGRSATVRALRIGPKDTLWSSGEFVGHIEFGKAFSLTPPHTHQSVFVARMNVKLGTFVKARHSESQGNALNSGLVHDKSGNVFVSGSFYKAIKLNASTFTAKRQDFSYLWKLRPF